MNSKHQKLFLGILMMVVLSLSQQPEALHADIIYDVSLKAQEHKKFMFKILEDPSEGQNFYIEAESPFNDPYEEAIMTITSSDDYQQFCYEESNDYTGICFIDHQDLKKDREFILDIYCIVDCSLKLSGYYNQIYEISLS